MIDIPGIYVGRFKDDPNQSTMLMQIGDTPTYTDDNWANVESTGTIWRYSSEAGEWIDTGLEEILVEEVSGTKEIVAEGTVPWKLQGLKVYGKSTQASTTGAQLLDISNEETFVGTKTFQVAPGVVSPFVFSASIEAEQGEDTIMVKFLKQGEGIYTTYTNPGTTMVPIVSNFEFDSILLSASGNDSNSQGKTVTYKNAMLNAGSTALPWEPYTGGKPSPSPDYPQEIVTAGSDGSIDLLLEGNNLIKFPYLYDSRTISGVEFTVLDTGGIKINGTAINDAYFRLTDTDFGNVNITSGDGTNGEYYFSGSKDNAIIWYDSNNKITSIKIQAGKSYNDVIIYPMVNAGSKALPYEPYKSQSLAISTPNGLPGIPVYSGGSYTDADGQQWVCDEVDFERGVYRKTVGVIENYQSESVNEPYISTTGQLSIGAKVIYPLSQQEETPLTDSQLQAYKALMSYDGTTKITADEDISGMSAKVVTDVISKNAWFDPYAELALYYKALAGFESLDNLPMPHSRESSLVRKLLDSSYELGFSVNENSSRNERYLWDLINGTSTMLTNVPKSDTEKFLHMMIGGTVEEYPVVDTELDYWMDKCVQYMNSNGNIGG